MAELPSTPESGSDAERVDGVAGRLDPTLHVVELSGELDLASRDATIRACASPERHNVLIDLSGLTFMDCAGYRGLVEATAILERRGGSSRLVNPVGEPRRLLRLIEQLQRPPGTPSRDDDPLAVPAATNRS